LETGRPAFGSGRFTEKGDIQAVPFFYEVFDPR
jgi:hypothetical protein